MYDPIRLESITVQDQLKWDGIDGHNLLLRESRSDLATRFMPRGVVLFIRVVGAEF